MSFSFLTANSRQLAAGFSLVEVVIGTSLILLSLTGLVAASSFYLKAGGKSTGNLKAAFLLQEGVEAVTLMRDDAWSNLSSLAAKTPYHLSWNGAKWVATTTAILADNAFIRTFQLDAVYRRDSDKDIVASSSQDAKTLDENTKELIVRVMSSSTPAIDASVVTYLANLFE